jgi:hypothetical protein
LPASLSDSDSEDETRETSNMDGISSLESSATRTHVLGNESLGGENPKTWFSKEDLWMTFSTKKRPRSMREGEDAGRTSELPPSGSQIVRLPSKHAGGVMRLHASRLKKDAQRRNVTGARGANRAPKSGDMEVAPGSRASCESAEMRDAGPILPVVADGSSIVPFSRSELGSSVVPQELTGAAMEAGQEGKCDLVTRGSSDTGKSIQNSVVGVSGAPCHGSLASHAKRYDHTVHLCSTLGVVMWSVDSNRRVTSAIGSKHILGYAGVPSLGRNILEGTETSVESKRTVRERYAFARKGERIESVLSSPGGERYLYILAPMRPRGSTEIAGVSGMLIEISGDTARP